LFSNMSLATQLPLVWLCSPSKSPAGGVQVSGGFRPDSAGGREIEEEAYQREWAFWAFLSWLVAKLESAPERSCKRIALLTAGHRESISGRQLIVYVSVEQSPRPTLVNTAPLLEEKRCPGFDALSMNGLDPGFFNRSRSRSTLPSDDYPADACQVDYSHIFQEGFYGEKPYLCW
jgi:hypothetical protein